MSKRTQHQLEEHLFEHDLRQCKGRNPFKSDATIIEHHPHEATVYVVGRVASNGNLNHGWIAFPDDPALLKQIAAALTSIAES